MVGFQVVDLQPGQFVFGRKKAAQELGMSEQNIRTCVDHLRRLENIAIKSTNKYSVITIINWVAYQQDQPTDQPTDQPPSNQHLTTNKNAKNGKKEDSLPESVLSFVQRYYEYVNENYPEKRVDLSNGKVTKGAMTVDKLIRLDGYDLDEHIRPALNWGLKDDFWNAQLNSLAELRKKKSGAENHKFDNLYQKYIASKPKQKVVEDVW